MSGEPKRSRSVTFGKRKPKKSPLLRFNLQNPLIQIALFACFMVGLVLLMTRTVDLSGGAISESNVGEVAQADIKASREFTYTEKDTEATDKKRQEAAAGVLKVYDHHTDLKTKRRDHIVQAFSTMREILQREELEKQRAGAEREPPPIVDPVPAEARSDATSDMLTPRERVRVAEVNRVKFDQALQVIVSDEHFAELARDGFSRSAEIGLTRLVGDLLGRHVVPNRRLLELEGRRGITVRTLREGEVDGTKRRVDFAEFIDAGEIPDELSRAAGEHLEPIQLPGLRAAIIGVAQKIVQPNTLYNEEQTEEARAAARAEVPDLVFQKPFKKGQNIVDRGHVITPQHVRIIAAMEGQQDTRLTRALIIVGTVVICLTLMLLLFIFARRYLPHFDPRPKDMVLLGGTILGVLFTHQGLTQLFESLGADWTGQEQTVVLWAIPIALGAMLVRLVLNTEIAIVYAILVAIFLGIAADNSLTYGTYALVASTAAAASVSRVNRRMDLLIAGLSTGAVSAIAAVALTLTNGVSDWQIYTWAAVSSFSGGVAAGVLVSAVLPVVEWVFNYTTDIKLLELADLNHPALRELFMRAPGSYNHSIMVGNLCKEAAEAIGANPLLARVGAYYHDLGKGKNPQYFAENQRPGHNPHDKLKPNMSALILKAHVKDGLEIARQYGLPKEIQSFIAQHHGTSLIAYFYHKAKSLEDPSIPEVDEEDYRYPGPRPQTRETAICMLADGIEAASRAMPEPTHDRLQGLVQKMINKAFADGQLDECDLTLKDLNAIAKAFIHVLCSMYHHRPQYPSDKKKSRADTDKRPEKTPNAQDEAVANESTAEDSRPASGGKTLFEDRLGDDNPEVLAMATQAASDASQPAIIVDRLEERTRAAAARQAANGGDAPTDAKDTPADASDADPPAPGGDDDVEGDDQPGSPDETGDVSLRRLGLN